MTKSANKAINSDVKKLRRSYLALQLFASGYGWRYIAGSSHMTQSRHTVSVVLDPSYGDKLTELAEAMHV